MLFFSFFFFIYITIHPFFLSYFFSFFFQANPKPLSVYYPTSEEVSATIGTPMKGFFDGADIMTEAWPLLLLLHRKLLPRLRFLHLGLVLLRRIPRPRWLLSSLLFLLRLLLLRKESLLRMHLRLRVPLLLLLMSFVLVIPLLPSLRP